MIEDRLIVEYDPFIMQSRISILKDGKRSYTTSFSTIEDLSRTILKLAYEKNLYNVMVHGPFGVERQISKTVQTYEKNQYNANKINIGGLPN